VRDDDMLRLSAKKMRAASGPEFHFLITLDSHIPFDFISDEEKEIYPHSTDWQENYFNSIRVLDHAVQRYVEALPPGTLLVFYGDHTAGVNNEKFHSARDGDKEFVPCIVYTTGANEAMARTDLAGLPADLRIHDVVNHLRRQVGTTHFAAR
jgi:phosphoglycerol transferase MdoB-like AlkP superfamily enzyme